jgi:outer membrane receptor protein involved in Fe transport
LLDLGAGYHLNDKLELRLIIRNLADELYFAAADAANDRSPGRSFTLALSGSL